MSVEVNILDDFAVVTLAGEAGLAQAAELKEALTPAVLEFRELRLDVGGLTSLDTALLQAVHALRCSSRGQGRRVSRVAALQLAVVQAAADAGAAGLGCGRVCGEAACIFEEQS